MKTRSFSLIATLIVLVLVGGFLYITRSDEGMQNQRSNEPIPYIYYYSDLEHAFVIERADGTDSRLLAQGVMPEDHDVIDSVHWSPTGQYLAWRSHRHNGPGAYTVNGWLASSDGSYVSDLLNDAGHVIHMEWSPNGDILAVLFFDDNIRYDQIVRLINVPENRIIAEIASHSSLDAPQTHFHTEIWASDGSSVYFTTVELGIGVLTRLYLDGSSERWFSTDRYPLNYNSGRIMYQEYDRRDGSNHYDWSFIDLTTGESRFYHSVSAIDSPDIVRRVIWNPMGEYVVTYAASGLALFDWVNGERYPLDNISSIALDINRRPVEYPWSPDGKVLMLQDAEDSLYLMDTVTQELFPIPITEIVLWKWLNERDAIILAYYDNAPHAFRYNWANDSTQELVDISPNLVPLWDNFDISPDGTFIGYYGTSEIHIQNIETGENYLYPTSNTTSSIGYPERDRAMGYKWSSDNHWFFSETAFEALMIHHIDAAFGRELTQCYDVDTCVGFVPDHVLPHLSEGHETSVIPAPMYTLYHEYFVDDVVWNNDGTHIATYSVDYRRGNYGLISLWTMTGDNPVLEQTIVIDTGCTDLRDCSLLDDIFSVSMENEDYQVMMTEDDESLAFLINSETHERISDSPLMNFYDRRSTAFDYNPHNNLLVFYGTPFRDRIWNVESGEELTQPNWGSHTAQFNPDGTRLAVAGSRFVSIWDMSPYIEQVQGD